MTPRMAQPRNQRSLFRIAGRILAVLAGCGVVFIGGGALFTGLRLEDAALGGIGFVLALVGAVIVNVGWGER